MEKHELSNGIRLVCQKANTNSTTVQVLVKTGSNNESREISGVSHFIEHMLFEGTKKRKTSMLISNEIERLGGVFNAYTSGEITCYYVKLANRHVDKALDILSDMLLNPLFQEHIIEKEKKVILKELHMVTDDPRFYQWRLFQDQLFQGHPASNPTLGTEDSLRSMSRKKLLDYYGRFYASNNMVISVVGNFPDIRPAINRYFGDIKPNSRLREIISKIPRQKFSMTLEKRKILSSYWVLGYKTASRTDKESYALDVIAAILGRGQSGKIFDEIRNKKGLAYEVGINHEHSKDYGYFSVYASTDKSRIEKGKQIVLRELKKLKAAGKSDVNDAKTYIEGRYGIEMDETDKFADRLAYWEYASKAEDAFAYLKRIKEVSVNDVRNAARKFFNDDYTMVVVGPE
ncbi:insulinase family protein [Candidatus Woesearchaeota archaeon]|nr:insulinase family protein [Candidatus Woesearchaeota archaeon]